MGLVWLGIFVFLVHRDLVHGRLEVKAGARFEPRPLQHQFVYA